MRVNDRLYHTQSISSEIPRTVSACPLLTFDFYKLLIVQVDWRNKPSRVSVNWHDSLFDREFELTSFSTSKKFINNSYNLTPKEFSQMIQNCGEIKLSTVQKLYNW